MKKNKLTKIFGKLIIIIILIAGIYLDSTNIFSNYFHLSIEFWSAMVGAFVTIFGVWWTLKNEGEKSKMELRESVKPIFNLTTDFDKMCTGNESDYTIKIIRHSKEINIKVTNEINLCDCSLNNLCKDFIIIKVRNIGLGHGIIDGIGFSVKEKKKTNKVELKTRFAIDKGTSNIIKLNFPVTISDIKEIKIFLSDIIGNKYRYSINFTDLKHEERAFLYTIPGMIGLKTNKTFDKLSFEDYLPVLDKKHLM